MPLKPNGGRSATGQQRLPRPIRFFDPRAVQSSASGRQSLRRVTSLSQCQARSCPASHPQAPPSQRRGRACRSFAWGEEAQNYPPMGSVLQLSTAASWAESSPDAQPRGLGMQDYGRARRGGRRREASTAANTPRSQEGFPFAKPIGPRRRCFACSELVSHSPMMRLRRMPLACRLLGLV